ncbi:MAG: LPS export ABC transporter periplasmic protein LptC [Rhodocyclaceae bacterium]
MSPLRGYSLFPIMLMVFLVGLTTWLQHATDLDQPRNDGKQRHDPDFTAENFTVHQLDAEGNIKYSLVGARMVHFPDDESTDLTNPRLTYLANLPPLHLQAKWAKVSKDGEIVDLYEDVFGRRESTGSEAEMTFRTTELRVLPDDEFASTDAPVTLTQGPTVINGTGMDADNLKRLFTLRERVTGTIYSKKSEP